MKDILSHISFLNRNKCLSFKSFVIAVLRNRYIRRANVRDFRSLPWIQALRFTAAGMTTLIAVFILFTFSELQAQEPTGKEILNRIDRNMSSETRIFKSKMIIHGRRGTRNVLSKSWLEGERKSFTEFLAPPREEGTKMLKLENHLWMYAPSTDRTIQISGHMLRQSLMGSDLSYEDMMEDSKLYDNYQADVMGTEIIDERSCWIVQLTAKNKDIAYHSRRLWVDKERSIPLREELFAKSGTLLKKIELKNIEQIDGRWFPRRIIFKDMLKKGGGTEFVIEEIEFNAPIPQYVFSKAGLKR